MKKILFLIVSLLTMSAFAYDNDAIIKENSVQKRIDDIGIQILNANQIDKRVVFAYDKNDVKKALIDSKLSKRRVIVYEDYFKYIEDDNELAAFLAREILIAAKSYKGQMNGILSSLQIKASPKKFEITADKIAVDYLVNSGYNPIALITFIQKSAPQRRFDKISTKNLTSKRLAQIYEYIYTKYPYFLKHNEYLYNPTYQNFLLTSQNNRKLLEYKVQKGSREKLKYE